MPVSLDEFIIWYNAYDAERLEAGLLGLLFDRSVR
jgi:hypothetical protein